jgi:ubiquinone/menaquinone biosynthesis C-methylase UbiE
MKDPDRETEADPKLDFADHLNNPIRDYWWDYDYLQLMQKRLRLDRVKKALDMGCGIGHWSHALIPHLHPEARMTGLDNNARWVQEAIRSSHHRMDFQYGDAYSMPFPNESFDLVTCQSFFMHLEWPEKALKEAYRVLKKGGTLFFVELNNYGNLMRVNSAQEELSLEERLQMAELYALLEEGKKLCGDGFMGIHCQLPKLLRNATIRDVQCFKNDVTFNVSPPYKGDKQEAMIDFLLKFIEKGHAYVYPRDVTEKYFLTAKKDKDLYHKLMKVSDKLNEIYKQQILNHTFEGTFGSDGIVIVGKK